MKYVILCSKCNSISNWEPNNQRYVCSKCGNRDVDHQIEAKKLLDRNEIEKFLNYCSENLNVPWKKEPESNITYYCVSYCEEVDVNFCCKSCPKLGKCKTVNCYHYESEECENRIIK